LGVADVLDREDDGEQQDVVLPGGYLHIEPVAEA